MAYWLPFKLLLRAIMTVESCTPSIPYTVIVNLAMYSCNISLSPWTLKNMLYAPFSLSRWLKATLNIFSSSSKCRYYLAVSSYTAPKCSLVRVNGTFDTKYLVVPSCPPFCCERRVGGHLAQSTLATLGLSITLGMPWKVGGLTEPPQPLVKCSSPLLERRSVPLVLSDSKWVFLPSDNFVTWSCNLSWLSNKSLMASKS